MPVQYAVTGEGGPIMTGPIAGLALPDSAGVVMQGIVLADTDSAMNRVRNIGDLIRNMCDLILGNGKRFGCRRGQHSASCFTGHLQRHTCSADMFRHFADLMLYCLEFAYRSTELLALACIFHCHFEHLFHGATIVAAMENIQSRDNSAAACGPTSRRSRLSSGQEMAANRFPSYWYWTWPVPLRAR